MNIQSRPEVHPGEGVGRQRSQDDHEESRGHRDPHRVEEGVDHAVVGQQVPIVVESQGPARASVPPAGGVVRLRGAQRGDEQSDGRQHPEERDDDENRRDDAPPEEGLAPWRPHRTVHRAAGAAPPLPGAMGSAAGPPVTPSLLLLPESPDVEDHRRQDEQEEEDAQGAAHSEVLSTAEGDRPHLDGEDVRSLRR